MTKERILGTLLFVVLCLVLAMSFFSPAPESEGGLKSPVFGCLIVQCDGFSAPYPEESS